eukprot:TRINITY_DN16898_c0_g2_i1.p1 TRINITY_DN16898_c0_g2~~TRINITY_DN16898_c0_g2_i1.p1  ORF type:complete len:310 (+),score=69.67 TRINITY_DN16898_c0_g2_i1:60-989(+)
MAIQPDVAGEAFEQQGGGSGANGLIGNVALLALGLSFLVLLVAGLSGERLPLSLARRLAFAHLGACLLVLLVAGSPGGSIPPATELTAAGATPAWMTLSVWSLATHVIYFCVCEPSRRFATQLLHGPSFGGAFAVLAMYTLTLCYYGADGIASSASVATLGSTQAALQAAPLADVLFLLWIHVAPVLLHLVDFVWGFEVLHKAYSPPMGDADGRFGVMGAASLFALKRGALRAWTAVFGFQAVFYAWRTWRERIAPEARGGLGSLGEQIAAVVATLAAHVFLSSRLFDVPNLDAADERWEAIVKGKKAD